MREVSTAPGKRGYRKSEVLVRRSPIRPVWLVSVRLRLSAVRLKRQSEPASPTNYSNFVHEQNDYGRQRNPDGQRVASEEVQGHACPAEASSC